MNHRLSPSHSLITGHGAATPLKSSRMAVPNGSLAQGKGAPRSGFTLTEIVVATGTLMLFLAGVFTLFRGGQSAGSQAFWLQKTITGLRNTSRHITQHVQRATFPSTIVFPGRIIENTNDDYWLHVSSRGTLFATQSIAVAGRTAPGRQFLRFVESVPERRGFGSSADDTPGQLKFHIYSLTRDGRLLYHRFDETLPLTNPGANYMLGIFRPQVPPLGLSPTVSQELLTDVESVRFALHDETASTTPVVIDLTCAYPRGHTRRNERIVAVPNVTSLFHDPVDPAW
jgi:hypothetical protein